MKKILILIFSLIFNSSILAQNSVIVIKDIKDNKLKKVYIETKMIEQKNEFTISNIDQQIERINKRIISLQKENISLEDKKVRALRVLIETEIEE